MLHWPPVYNHYIAKYLKRVNTPQDLLHRLECELKEGKGFRYFAILSFKLVLAQNIIQI